MARSRSLKVLGNAPARPDGAGDDTQPGGDAELIAQGWERRHMADPQRAAEAIELYQSMDFEVMTRKPTKADFGPACGQCASDVCQTHLIIYTRKRSAG